jgi:hypothetical protein
MKNEVEELVAALCAANIPPSWTSKEDGEVKASDALCWLHSGDSEGFRRHMNKLCYTERRWDVRSAIEGEDWFVYERTYFDGTVRYSQIKGRSA